MLECGAAIGDTAHVSGECPWLGQVDLSSQPAATEFAKNQHPNSKQLKFGIDAILSSKYPVNCGKQAVELDYCSRYCNSSFHYCYQFDHLIATSSSFCPPLFISTTPFLPTARKYTNFVIETERNTTTSGTSKRKRIWSRAVFSKLQRKGLEKRFQVQKYIMKPDRKQLAATLGLTDAQVKVWFQNRRMKWRNRKENSSNKNVSEGTPKQT